VHIGDTLLSMGSDVLMADPSTASTTTTTATTATTAATATTATATTATTPTNAPTPALLPKGPRKFKHSGSFYDRPQPDGDACDDDETTPSDCAPRRLLWGDDGGADGYGGGLVPMMWL
jgi:hypothetical protein